MALALLTILAASCSVEDHRSQTSLVQVTGTVSLRNGSPLAGATVNFYTRSIARALSPLAPGSGIHATPPLLTWTGTNVDGAFRIRLPEGPWEVWIGGFADGVMRQHVADVALRLPSANLELHYLGYRLSGHLIGPGHTILDDGSLTISRGTNTMQSPVHSGGYSLFVPADTISVEAEPTPIGYEGGIPRVRYNGIVASSDTTIDFSLDGHAVTGKATGPGGISLYGGWVSASNGTATAYSSFASDGSYRIYLPTGEYVFTVYTGGRGNGTHVYDPILIDSPRTLDFDLPSGAPAP